jgi:hypothetical protein
LKDGLAGAINISQSGVSEKSLIDSIVATNRTVTATAVINDGSHFLKNASISYMWVVDGRTYTDAVLNYNFTRDVTYDIVVIVMVNITQPNQKITKLGKFTREIRAKNAIKELNVSGNTWLLHGALLQLNVNCTGGSLPFWYCWDSYPNKIINYSCSGKDLIYINERSFPIMHYFPKNGTYFIEIALYNDVDFKRKTIQVNVYDSK